MAKTQSGIKVKREDQPNAMQEQDLWQKMNQLQTSINSKQKKISSIQSNIQKAQQTISTMQHNVDKEMKLMSELQLILTQIHQQKQQKQATQVDAKAMEKSLKPPTSNSSSIPMIVNKFGFIEAFRNRFQSSNISNNENVEPPQSPVPQVIQSKATMTPTGPQSSHLIRRQPLVQKNNQSPHVSNQTMMVRPRQQPNHKHPLYAQRPHLIGQQLHHHHHHPNPPNNGITPMKQQKQRFLQHGTPPNHQHQRRHPCNNSAAKNKENCHFVPPQHQSEAHHINISAKSIAACRCDTCKEN